MKRLDKKSVKFVFFTKLKGLLFSGPKKTNMGFLFVLLLFSVNMMSALSAFCGWQAGLGLYTYCHHTNLPVSTSTPGTVHEAALLWADLQHAQPCQFWVCKLYI